MNCGSDFERGARDGDVYRSDRSHSRRICPNCCGCVARIDTAASCSAGGSAGEWAFLAVLGLLIFWLYYRNYLIGTEAILPADWRN